MTHSMTHLFQEKGKFTQLAVTKEMERSKELNRLKVTLRNESYDMTS